MNRAPQDVRTRMDRFTIPEPNSGCWLWLGAQTHNGYGRFSLFTAKGKPQKHDSAHRVAFVLANGEIPLGLQIDHRCNNSLCVNPEHLRAVTPRENIARSRSPVAENMRKTHCQNGHALDGANLIGSGARRCRECLNAWQRERRAAQKVR